MGDLDIRDVLIEKFSQILAPKNHLISEESPLWEPLKTHPLSS